MAEEKEIMQAKTTFETLCEMLNERKIKFICDDDKFTISFGMNGEDIPMGVLITVDPERMLIRLLSKIPFSVPKEKRAEIAVAVSVINNSIVDGCFDYNFLSGTIGFRMTSSFMESLIGKELFDHMIFVSCATIDMYNDKILMIIKDKMTIKDLFDFTRE